MLGSVVPVVVAAFVNNHFVFVVAPITHFKILQISQTK